MGGYLVEAIRIATVTMACQYGIKCLGKTDMSRIIKMTGMSMAGVTALQGVKYAYENPPQWILDVKEVGGSIAEVTSQLAKFDIKGLLGL